MRKAIYSFLSIIPLLLFINSTALAELPGFTGLAKSAGKAVVNISTVKTVKQSDGVEEFFKHFHGKDSPFEDFFDQFERFFGPHRMPKRQQRSLGSGFIVSKSGYIVTNNHVVKQADEITVNLQGGEKSYQAQIVGRDPETDLALLKIDVDFELSVLEFGNSEEMEIGDWVLAIGNPFGLDNSVTAGIISARGRVIGAGPYDDFLQTDASINPGNSGGPLLNTEGEVIGINTAIIASGQGIGFAIPSNMAKTVISQLKEYQTVKRGWLGVTIQDVDENMAKALGLKGPKGALIAEVRPGEPADEAGLKSGDVIIAVNGEPVEDGEQLIRRIGKIDPGTKVPMTIWRQGQVKEIPVVLGKRKLAQKSAKAQGPEQSGGRLGITVRPVGEDEAQDLGLARAEGLLVQAVKQGSLAADAGLRPGDIILSANGQKVSSSEALARALSEATQEKGAIMLFIKRKGQGLFVSIPLTDDQ